MRVYGDRACRAWGLRCQGWILTEAGAANEASLADCRLGFRVGDCIVAAFKVHDLGLFFFEKSSSDLQIFTAMVVAVVVIVES